MCSLCVNGEEGRDGGRTAGGGLHVILDFSFNSRMRDLVGRRPRCPLMLALQVDSKKQRFDREIRAVHNLHVMEAEPAWSPVDTTAN